MISSRDFTHGMGLLDVCKINILGQAKTIIIFNKTLLPARYEQKNIEELNHETKFKKSLL